jgi:hypothetical protein
VRERKRVSEPPTITYTTDGSYTRMHMESVLISIANNILKFPLGPPWGRGVTVLDPQIEKSFYCVRLCRGFSTNFFLRSTSFRTGSVHVHHRYNRVRGYNNSSAERELVFIPGAISTKKK